MKTAITIIAALLLAACNEGRPLANAEVSSRDLLVGDGQFAIRLLGVNPGDAKAVLIGVRELRVTAGGQALPVEIGQGWADLAVPDHAWLLGLAPLPPGTTEVSVLIVFDDFGGMEAKGGNHSIRARGTQVAFTAPVEWLQLNGHAVVQLDVAQSLTAERAGEKLLLPVLAVHY